MSQHSFQFSQKVTNRELDLYGETAVRKLIVLAFLRALVEQLQVEGKVQLTTRPCEVVASVDYTLPRFQFSEQFGTEYSLSLIVMTPEELAQHDEELCWDCSVERAIYSAGGANC